MPTEEIRKALEEAARKYSSLDEHLKELGDEVKASKTNYAEMSAHASNGKYDEADKVREIYLKNKEQAAAKSGQIVSLYEKDMDSRIESFFDGPKSTSDADILNWVTDNFLLFKLLSSKAFRTENPCKTLMAASDRVASAVGLALQFVTKNAPQLLDEDSLYEVSEKNYPAVLKSNFDNLGQERSALWGTYSIDALKAEVKTVAGKHRQAAPQAPAEEQQNAAPQNTGNAKSDEQPEQVEKPAEAPGSNIPRDLPVPIKPQYSYIEVERALDKVVEYADDEFKPFFALFNRNNFANGQKELGMAKQTLGNIMLRMIDEFSERKDDAEKYYDSIETLSADNAYTEIRSYYQRIYNFTNSYIKKNEDTLNDSVRKCVDAAKMANSYARDIIYNCKVKLDILKYTVKERSVKKISVQDVLNNKVPAGFDGGKNEQAETEAALAAEESKKSTTGKKKQTYAASKSFVKIDVDADKSNYFIKSGDEYTHHISLLMSGKTFTNSNEYLDIISTLTKMLEGKFGTDKSLSAKERYFSELVELKLLIDKYIVHKSKDGVKKNVYDKLAAVEGLNRHVTEELDALAPDIIADKSNPKMRKAKEKYLGITHLTLHPKFTQTYTKEEADARGENAEEFDDTLNKDSCEKALTCMDRIIHFAKPNMVKDLRKMQEEFYYLPGRGESPVTEAAKKALEDAEKALHMDPARKSGLKSVLDQGGIFKFDSKDYHSELKYCYALDNNIKVGLTVLDGGNTVSSEYNMRDADSKIGAFAGKIKSEKPLLGYSEQFDKDRGDLVNDIAAINDGVANHLIESYSQNKTQFSNNYNDRELLENWTELNLKGSCYKALLEEGGFRIEANKQKAQEIAELYTKLENRVKHLAKAAAAEPVEKAAPQVGGPVK